MSNPSVPIPSIIQGPAIVTLGSDVFYTKSGIKLNTKRPSFNVEDDSHGQIDVRSKGQAIVDLSFTPVGMVTLLTEKYRASYAAIAGGGTGTYVVGETLTAVGGTGTVATFKIEAVNTGAVTKVSVLTAGAYTAKPTNPVSTTGGSGSGATLTLSWANYSPLMPYNVDSIGKSIFGSAATTCIIQTIDGRKITYHRAGILKTPSLNLKPSDTLMGDMTIRCLGIAATQMTDPAYLLTRASAGFSDASFDETKIVTDIYSAAYGTTPYDAMGAMDGFEIALDVATKDIETDDFGLVDTIVTSLAATAKFRPSNLTEAQLDTLLNYQNSGVIIPGQSFSKSNTDLVIAGVSGALVATIKNAGPHQNAAQYQTAQHVHDQIEFVSKRTWTSGAANALWSLVVT